MCDLDNNEIIFIICSTEIFVGMIELKYVNILFSGLRRV